MFSVHVEPACSADVYTLKLRGNACGLIVYNTLYIYSFALVRIYIYICAGKYSKSGLCFWLVVCSQVKALFSL